MFQIAVVHKMNRKRLFTILFAVGLVLWFFAGVGVRRAVLYAQYTGYGRQLPFTLESALQFRLVEKVYEEGGLPDTDIGIEPPGGLHVASEYTIGAEYLYALLARIMPGAMPLAERVRWAETLWFCLAVPLLGLWVYGMTGSRWSGWIAAGYYALGAGAVVRSSGIELGRENFALPWLVAHLACHAWASKRGAKEGIILQAVLSALFLAAACMTWDLVQYYVGLWALVSAGAVLYKPQSFQRKLWGIEFAALVIVSIFNPYLRAHGWLFSPGLLMGYGICLLLLAERRIPVSGWRRCLFSASLLFLPLLAGLFAGWLYRSGYSHFGSLLWAKIRFLNTKPADPALLSFAQRIMWVPALHAPTARMAIGLFPALLLLTFTGGVVLSFSLRTRPRRELIHQLFFCGFSLITFCFFVRFHVFFALFSAALMGWLAAWALEASWWKRIPVVMFLVFGLVAEAANTLHQPQRWGRGNVYYEELDELCTWLSEEVAPETVLANFGTSASILTYGGCPIVLHPKFETKRLRRKVEEYGTALFKGDEVTFRDWADEHDALYYVHGLGEFSSRHPERQMRYFVDALEPPDDAAARLFEFQPHKGRYFHFLWGNRKYRVFRITSREAEHKALALAAQAEGALQRGDIDGAERDAMKALELDPYNREAMQMLSHVDALREDDFDYEAPRKTSE